MLKRIHSCEVYAILWVTRDCEAQIAACLSDKCGVPRNAIQPGLHLTVYYARRYLPGLIEKSQPVSIEANADETRFMVLAPGGENPRPNLVPENRSVGIRLTRRNQAIESIQALRESLYRLETPQITIGSKPTSAWRSCFGVRRYQPHIKLLRPGSRVGTDLYEVGALFRSEIELIEFNRFQVKINRI